MLRCQRRERTSRVDIVSWAIMEGQSGNWTGSWRMRNRFASLSPRGSLDEENQLKIWNASTFIELHVEVSLEIQTPSNWLLRKKSLSLEPPPFTLSYTLLQPSEKLDIMPQNTLEIIRLCLCTNGASIPLGRSLVTFLYSTGKGYVLNSSVGTQNPFLPETNVHNKCKM